MKRRYMVGLVFVFLLWLSSAMAQEPRVRARIAPQETNWVGQRITLVVELLPPGVFDSAPTFDLPDPPGMLLMPPSGSPILSSETIDGVFFTVQRHELSVFAQRPGEQTIPPLTVRFQFKRNALDHDSVAASATTAPIKFVTKLPPGAEKLGSVISARDLRVVES